jgi:predicted HD phosphohydrolase
MLNRVEQQVAHLVEGHVLAKRYLCFARPEYYDQLSGSSKATLVYQGNWEASACYLSPNCFLCVIASRRRCDNDMYVVLDNKKLKNPDCCSCCLYFND